MNRVTAVCLNYLLSHTAYFALTTVAGVYLCNSKGVTVAETALLVALLVFCHRGARFFVGPFLGRFDLRGVMLVGTSTSLAGLALLALGPSLAVLVPAVILTGCGYSIRGVAVKSYLTVASTSTGDHLNAFSQLNWFLNAAAILGPLVGSGLLMIHAEAWIPLALIGLSGLSLVHLLLGVVPLRSQPTTRGARIQLGLDRELITILASLFLFHSFLSLMFEVLPFHLVRYTTLGNGSGALLVLNGIVVVVFQRFCTSWVRRRQLHFDSTLQNSLFAFVPATVTLVLLLPWPIIGAVLYVMLLSGYEMVMGPQLDAAVSTRIAATGVHGLWSFTGLAAAFGEGAGVLIGFQLLGAMYETGLLAWFWLLLASIEGLAGLAFFLAKSSGVQRHKNTSFPES